jgi:hypothetical protein
MIWTRAHKATPECAALADRHYSRRKVGSPQFMPPGQTIVLSAPGAVFGWWRPAPSSGIVAMNGLDSWTCSIFRNESSVLSSTMILEAERFVTECGPDGLLTYVWDAKIRSSNPGACFKAAGWRRIGKSADGKKTLLWKAPTWIPKTSPLNCFENMISKIASIASTRRRPSTLEAARTVLSIPKESSTASPHLAVAGACCVGNHGKLPSPCSFRPDDNGGSNKARRTKESA